MKVGFAGAQGTGKTTLAKAMTRSAGFHFSPSISASAVNAGFKVNREADRLSQLVTTVSRINAENTMTKKPENKVVFDRTVMDSLAYTQYQDSHVWEDPNFFYFKQSFDLVFDHSKTYDHVFYFPAYWQPKERPDGLRDSDVLYQGEIDFYIKSILDAMQVPYVTIPKGNTEDRLKFVLDVLY